MSLSTTVNKAIHLGNGLATSFSYTFPIQVAADLVVIFTDASGVETTLTPSQYSVTGIGTPIGGAVTYPLGGSPIATGTSLTILRTVANTQPTVLSNQGGYFPEVVEAALDRIVMIEQQLNEKIGRSLVTPVTDASPLAIPQDATARANTALLFDADGNPYAGALVGDLSGVSPFILANLLPAANAGAARTVLGVTNANLGAFGAIRVQTFTGTGTYTPHANMVTCTIECWGAGGGGGGVANPGANTAVGGGGGGAGGYSRKIATAADIGASKAVTIGAAGTAGASGGASPGGSGGNTSVGALCIANGGTGGAGATTLAASLGGLGGTAGTGDVAVVGGNGGTSTIESTTTTTRGVSGQGASSGIGGGGRAKGPGGATGVAGEAATGFAAGGGGGVSFNAGGAAAGGAGTAGYVIITEYCSA